MAMTGIQGSYSNYEEYLRQSRIPKQNEIPSQQPEQLQDISSTPSSEQVQNTEIVPTISADNATPVELFENERTQGGFTKQVKDSDIGQLDIQQAISDMQKDSILHQYQYFVGTSSDYNMLVNDQDGVVLKKISDNS